MCVLSGLIGKLLACPFVHFQWLCLMVSHTRVGRLHHRQGCHCTTGGAGLAKGVGLGNTKQQGLCMHKTLFCAHLICCTFLIKPMDFHTLGCTTHSFVHAPPVCFVHAQCGGFLYVERVISCTGRIQASHAFQWHAPMSCSWHDFISTVMRV
jgi:hypothetical protein